MPIAQMWPLRRVWPSALDGVTHGGRLLEQVSKGMPWLLRLLRNLISRNDLLQRTHVSIQVC